MIEAAINAITAIVILGFLLVLIIKYMDYEKR